jgi:hypothetical protein
VAELPLFDRAALGKGWQQVTMANNAERLDPCGEDPASAVVRSVRDGRVLTGLDEGRAFRERRTGSLVVVRVELFADEGAVTAADHRHVWQEHGVSSLEATWRERWRERDIEPGWIEVAPVGVAERPEPLHAFADVDPAPDPTGSIDWCRVEDHTDPAHEAVGRVLMYEHLSVWAGRALATITLRHELGTPGDAVAAAAAAHAHRRLVAAADGRSR